MRLEVLLEPAGQLEHGALMRGARGRRHDEIAPDDLVAQTVVGEAPDLLGGVSRHQRGHGHKMVTSRAQGQLGMGRAYRSACEARHRGYAVRAKACSPRGARTVGSAVQSMGSVPLRLQQQGAESGEQDGKKTCSRLPAPCSLTRV